MHKAKAEGGKLKASRTLELRADVRCGIAIYQVVKERTGGLSRWRIKLDWWTKVS